MNDLLELVWAHDELAELDPAARRLALRELVAERVAPEAVAEAVARLANAVDGYGPLSELVADPTVTDVLVNAADDVWIERAGSLQRVDVRFEDERELHGLVDRLLASSGRRVDASHPIADARLPDGSRLHVALPPIAARGIALSIRRFPPQRPSLDDLVALGMMSGHEARVLREAVAACTTIAISGATGTGKTTLLNALLGLVDRAERVITIEETPELVPACAHVVSLVARPENTAGKGAIDLAMLVRAALRMRPDRIVVGEARGAEMLAALAAMSTGHEGSMLTIHARSATDALERMLTLALQSPSAPSEATLRRELRAAVGMVVHLERDHLRRVGEIRRCCGDV